jgi:hypothetical protein
MSSNENALQAVPQMQELSDDSLRQMMGGLADGCGRYCSITCDCGCTLCTSWIYSCTSAAQMQ